MTNREINFFLLVGFSILVFIFSLLALVCVSFYLNFALSGFQVFLALFLTILFSFCVATSYSKQERIKFFILLWLFLSATSIGFLFFSANFYDIWCDGQMYHQEAIVQLSRGWNPFNSQLLAPELNSRVSTQINCFAKGPWLVAAALYKLLGHIEPCKVFNLLLILASFCLSFCALLSLKRIKLLTVFSLALIFSLNPISVTQSLSFYIDGQLASLLLCLASLAYLLLKRRDKFILALFAITIILIINVKLTGPVYITIFAISILIWFFIFAPRELFFKVFKISLVSFVLGMCLVGYSPYVTNLINHGNSFYPVVGAGKWDLMEGQMPENFYEMNNLERLFVSLFSKSENVPAPFVATLKLPFTFSLGEFKTFIAADIRVGGFGPLFSGAIILAALIVILAFFFNLEKAAMAIYVISFVLLSVFINPQAWWARFVPQLFFLPVIAIILSLYIRNRWVNALGYLLIFILMINTSLISYFYLNEEVKLNQILKQELKFIADNADRAQVLVKFNSFRSNRFRLQELGIKYQEVQVLPDLNYMELVGFGEVMTQVVLIKNQD